MTATLRTKDGSFSVAKAILADERKASRHVLIAMEEALDWAHKNGLKINKKAKNPLGRLNTHRVGLGLPPFKLLKSKEAQKKVARVASKRAPLPPLVASEDELLDRIMNHTGMLTGTITPEIAGWLLKLNTNNRPLERRGVERFCKILADKAWVNTGEPVIVSNEGVLNDGQHRLTAIHTCGIAAEVDMRFGIDRDAFHATGTGRSRTAGHVLAIEGYSNTSCQAAIARLLIHYDKGQMGNRSHVEPGAILRIVDSDDRVCAVAARIQRFKLPPIRTGAFGFVLVVAARTAPMERVFEFADHVAHGWAASAEEARPTHTLHEKLSQVAMTEGERLTPIDLTVKTWYTWSVGEPTVALRVTDADRTSIQNR